MPTKPFSLPVLTLLLTLLVAITHTEATAGPNTPARQTQYDSCPPSAGFMMLWNDEWLRRVKASNAADAALITPALEAVLCRADVALQRGPFSVAHKTGFPPGGDIHDYYSLAPYWWPDPDKENGLPYIRRDGETNPERYGDGVDGKRRHDMVLDVTALTLAGFYTDDARYLDHAARQIRTWFIDPDTTMNPNMEHAQYIPGRSAGRSYGIIDSRSFVRVIEAARLLHRSGHLDDEGLAALKDWFGRFAKWLAESPHGRKEASAKNNHGTFYDLQLAAFSEFSGDEKTAKAVIAAFPARRLRDQIAPGGKMPLELERTRPFHYTLFNLQAIMNMALLADRLGVELLAEDRENDDFIRAAIAYVSGNGHDWPLDRTHPDYEPLFELLLLYDTLTGTDEFETMRRESGSAFDASVIYLLLPPQARR